MDYQSDAIVSGSYAGLSSVTITYATAGVPPPPAPSIPDLPEEIDLPEVVEWLSAQSGGVAFFVGNTRTCVVGRYVRSRFGLGDVVRTCNDSTAILVPLPGSTRLIRHTKRLEAFIAAFDNTPLTSLHALYGLFYMTQEEALALARNVLGWGSYRFVRIEDVTLCRADEVTLELGGAFSESADLVLQLPERRAMPRVPA